MRLRFLSVVLMKPLYDLLGMMILVCFHLFVYHCLMLFVVLQDIDSEGRLEGYFVSVGHRWMGYGWRKRYHAGG